MSEKGIFVSNRGKQTGQKKEAKIRISLEILSIDEGGEQWYGRLSSKRLSL